jgi:hypothetical protein
METQEAKTGYVIWSENNTTHGPVELPALVDWVKEGRVTATTWIFVQRTGVWQKSGELPELQMFFSAATPGLHEQSEPVFTTAPDEIGIPPQALRRIKILAVMSDAELAKFCQFITVQEFKVFSTVVKAGEHGNSMYMIFSGEVRARSMIDSKETTLATLGVGDYFGEISLLDEGPRSADIVTNTESVVLNLSASAFGRMRNEAPRLALDFVYALGRSAAGKIRTLTKRYQDSVNFSRYAAWRL